MNVLQEAVLQQRIQKIRDDVAGCMTALEDVEFSLRTMENAVKEGNREVEAAKKDWRESARKAK
jgi:dGTP triphosphohydrolase